MKHDAFYVRAIDVDGIGNLATGIQVILPEGLSYEEALNYIVGRISGEVARYFAQECLNARLARHGIEPMAQGFDWFKKIT